MRLAMVRLVLVAACLWAARVAPAQDADAPAPSTAASRHIARCLEQAAIRFEYLPDGDMFRTLWQTERWTNDEGERSALIQIYPDLEGDVVVSFPVAYDLSLCAHLAACRKVMAEAYWKAGIRGVQLIYDPADAEVRAVLHAHGQVGRIEAKQLRALVEKVLSAVDSIDPVMRKAIDTGNVDWPSDDTGPGQPTQEFTVRLGALAPFKVGVAPWVEPEMFASTLLTFDEFGKQLVGVNDEEAESLGARLFEPYRDGEFAWSVYRDWSAFWLWVKQHYPPIAVRVWGPPGLVVRGRLSCEGYLAAEAESEALIDGSGSAEINFVPEWNEDALLRLPAARKLPLRIAIEVPMAATEPAEVVLKAQSRLHPVGVAQLDMPLTLPIAMQVNEEHPWIDGLLLEAKRAGVCAALGNMPDTAPAEQVRQVFAVWKALRDRGIAYSNIASAATARLGQRVRSLHECIAGEQANCLDGVAALASLLKALDFDVHVVGVPGHTFLTVVLNSEEGADAEANLPELLVIETTWIGREFDEKEMAEVDLLDAVESALRPSGVVAADWRAFEAACLAGSFQFEQAREDKSLRMIPLSLLRDCGLRTLPALRSEIGALPAPPRLDDVVRERAKRDAIEDEADAKQDETEQDGAKDAAG
ncbi:MAG: hypothetical protein ACKOYN_00745 [Planctomycetota bacterium]